MDSNKKSSIKKKLISFGIVVLIIAIVFLVGTMKNKQNAKEMYGTTADSDNVQTEITVRTPNADEFSNTLVAESENYELYLDGPTLSITLKNKTTGKVLESAIKEDDGKSNKQWSGFIKSGIVLNIIDGKNDQVQADLVNNAHEIAIEEIENGFLAYVTFVDFGFSFEMTVTLEEDELIVKIPDNKVIESIEKYRIGAINVFPFLGYTYLGEQDGYMLIPDGNGALIYLNDKEGRLSGGFSRMIYGEDAGFKDAETVSLLWDQLQTVNESENLLAPIFGMVHTEDQIGFLGIIEEGAQRASIEAYPNGVTIDYNRIYPKFILRKVYKQPTSESSSGTTEMIEKDRSHNDIKIRYCLVSGSDANYTGLAIKYRNYLLDSNEIAVKDNSYHTRLDFLGVEKEEWLIFKKDVVMTTVSDIRDILADLKEEGITEVLSVYKGWQNGGLYQVPITSYKADSAIGGTSELTELIKDVKKDGNQLYLYQDALRINPDENNTTFNVVKRVDKRLFEENTYQQVYNKFLYLTPARSSFYMDSLVKDYSEKDISGVSLAGITNSLYSYSYSGDYYARSETEEVYDKMISGISEEFDLALEQPFSYLWKYTDAFLDMPVGTSQYIFEDEEIPFISIVLKGVIPMYSDYTNFEANKQEFFLKLIETGIYPSFYITEEDSSKLIYTNSSDIYSSKYSIYKNEIIEYSTKLKEVSDAVRNSYITGHQRLGNGVTVVSYDNGILIYINYSDNDQTIDGYLVEAMSYKVGEAK